MNKHSSEDVQDTGFNMQGHKVAEKKLRGTYIFCKCYILNGSLNKLFIIYQLLELLATLNQTSLKDTAI
jgi:hypothetical protein